MKSKYLKNVSTIKLIKEKCKGCGMCIQVCPHEVFQLREEIAEIINKDLCMECGACAKNCPFSAVQVNAGVGCAYAIIKGLLTGTEPSCDCSEEGSGCC